MKIQYVGKCLLLEESGERVLVLGDLHLGYEGSMRNSGVMIPVKLYEKCISDFTEIIMRVGGFVDKIIILGDLKHEFGRVLPEEWSLIQKFLKKIQEHSKKLIVLEGNHDVILFPIMKQMNIEAVDFYEWKNVIFSHGDKDFEKLYLKEINYWVFGHGHPAIVLRDGITRESYKCFLKGKFKDKNVILVPSFFPLINGTDPREFDLGYPFEFKLGNFEVYAVGDRLEVLNFGKLIKLKN